MKFCVSLSLNFTDKRFGAEGCCSLSQGTLPGSKPRIAEPSLISWAGEGLNGNVNLRWSSTNCSELIVAERSDFARRLTQPLLPTGCTHHIWPNLLNLDLSALVCFVTESRREELAGFRWMSLLLTFLHLIKN